MYIYGIHPVLSFLKYKREVIKKVLCNQELYKRYISKEVKDAIILDNKEISKITNIHEHQGVVAEITYFPYVDFEIYSSKATKICILDHIEDPGNVGAIIRNALAFKIELVVIPKYRACEITASAIKASAGAAAIVPVALVTNINNAIRYLKEKGFWTYGFESSGESNLSEITFDNKTVIILGSEGKGIHKLTKDLCDFLVKIESEKEVSSLNVASASAIAFYKLYSQFYVA